MLPARHSSRRGFTLVELLIVISIIAILLALGASATVRVIDVQRGNNTEQTVKIVSEILDRHWVAVVDKASRNEEIPSSVWAALQPFGITDPDIVRVVYVKLRLRQEFPMNFDEARNPAVLPPIPAYLRALEGVNPDAGGRTSQSSACLLLALQQARAGITFDADRLAAGAVSDAHARPANQNNPQHVANAQSLKQLIDGFGNPLIFTRWPTESPELNPGGLPQAGHNDSTDRLGVLTRRTIANNGAFKNWFRNPNIGHALPDNQNGPLSYKLTPVIVSAGRNGTFGLDLTTLRVVTPEQANDNVYSYRLRFGARGD